MLIPQEGRRLPQPMHRITGGRVRKALAAN
jgi:hypothetical protein